MNAEDLERIENLLFGEDVAETERAIDQLVDLLKRASPDQSDEARMHQGRIRVLSKRMRTKRISTEDADVEWNSIKNDVQDFIHALNHSRNPNSARTRSGAVDEVPDLLPYSFDRHDQHDILQDKLAELRKRSARKPLIVVIHGNKHQCHDEYGRYLRTDEQLPRWLQLDRQREKPAGCLFDWQVPDRSTDVYHRRLCRAICQRLPETRLNQLDVTAEQLADELKHEKLVFWDTYTQTPHWQKCDVAEGFNRFLQFWEKWPPLPANQWLIVCVGIEYEETAGGWFGFLDSGNKTNRLLRDYLDGSIPYTEEKIDLLVLPRFTDVEMHHAVTWAHAQARNGIYGKCRLVERVQELFKVRKAIPLAKLAPDLKKILVTCSKA